MATMDLLDRLGLVPPAPAAEDDDLPDIPDDASELDDDSGDDLPEDPKPSRRQPKFSLPSGGQGRATPAERKQVKDALALLIKAPAGLLAMRDPHCGGALSDQADAIIKAMIPIICRNPAMLRWFTAANAPWLDILALMSAFGPVVATVYGHHVKHTIGGEASTGGPDLSAYGAPSV